MRISTDNGPIRNMFGDVKAVEMIAAAGFDGIDYTFYDISKENDILALPIEEMRALAHEVKAAADRCGIAIPVAHAPFGFKYTDTKDSYAFEEVVRSFEFAHILGVKKIVVHTIKFPYEDYKADVWAFNRQFMLDLLPYAEKFDLMIGIENLFIRDKKRARYVGHNGTPEEVNAFIDSLGSDRFCACCDLGHCALTGREPEEYIRGMSGERLTMLHVQDTDYMSDTHTIPYLGKHNWDEITSALAEIDYKGYMNLEVLGFYRKFPASMVPDALKMAAQAARHLADMVDEKKQKMGH